MSTNAFVIEAAFVDFFATHIWHRIRPLFSAHLKKRCQNCLLSEAYTPLNPQGICELCENYKPLPTSYKTNTTNIERLNAHIQNAIGQGAYGYDALVLVSGGKDSAYMLNKLHQEHPKLRVLTLLIDNGFMSPFAIENAQELLKKFNNPHITLRSHPSFVRKTFVEMLTHLDRQTGYSIVDLADGFMTFSAARILAAEKKIPLIICGLSRVQTEQVFQIENIELTSAQEAHVFDNYLKINASKIYSEDEKNNWYHLQAHKYNFTPKFILPFLAWEPTEIEVIETVERLKLINKKCSRPLLTNNRLIPVIGMAEVSKFGYSCFETEFARMIREGKSERQYWVNLFEMLEYSARTGRFVNKTVKETLAQLGLTGPDIGLSL